MNGFARISILVAAACVAVAAPARGDTTASTGPGSAVVRIDRTAIFDALNADGIALSDYTEGQLFLGVDGDSLVGFDPYHGTDGAAPTFEYPDNGSYGWVTIRTTDSKRIFGLEFLYANGWTTGDSTWPWGNDQGYVEWQTWLGGKMVSSGTIGGSGQVLPMGTVIGFYDPAGFDELLVRCRIATSADPDLQALILDNVNVQLEASASWSNYGSGWAGAQGVPTITPSANPVLGTSISIAISNSTGTTTTDGLVLIGATEANVPTTKDGTLLVDPYLFLPVLLPPAGLTLDGVLPAYDPALCGIELDLQAIELDGQASRGVSFTPGLRLVLGV